MGFDSPDDLKVTLSTIMLNEINNDDSNIKKLKLNNINDLQIYLQDLIESQMINTTIKNNVIRKTGFKDVKLIIKTI